MTTKSTRGGFRQGSGRPSGQNTVPLCVRISREAMKRLNAANINKSQLINDLILREV